MNTSSRFIVATHILSALAISKDRPMKSETLAVSVNTNAVVVRRILGKLRNAGLVRSQTGPDGGARLARNAEEISLLEIYEAVEDGKLFHFHYNNPSVDCPVGANIQDCICGVFDEAESAMKAVLSRNNLGDIVQDILEHSGLAKKLERGMTVAELQQKYDFRDGRLIKKSR